MKIAGIPLTELFTDWSLHLASFWVPCIVGLIFVVCAIREIRHGHIRLFLLQLVLALGCFGYIFHEEVMNLFSAVLR